MHWQVVQTRVPRSFGEISGTALLLELRRMRMKTRPGMASSYCMSPEAGRAERGGDWMQGLAANGRAASVPGSPSTKTLKIAPEAVGNRGSEGLAGHSVADERLPWFLMEKTHWRAASNSRCNWSGRGLHRMKYHERYCSAAETGRMHSLHLGLADQGQG
ncbi:hypothetical protein TASIC1_0014017600 [Trichoderma asperellum]|uniref:Uncharacterized protein n=1 Tax=Trichoderma asperellum TaxID=101201 RepID=A0A6V8R3X0_TRIAP|nr:hypothetical protein LI328DRAFT_164658 [Trichoderma asperelloides]GFP59754.1 hypothetical protein TASIC1_0014017600 [Trichoderma asperellum]